MVIKKLQQNFTTTEQSKRLLELGVPADSADCYLQNESQDPLAYVNYTTHIIQPFHDKRIMFSQQEDFLPCWSVGRLIEILLLCHKSNEAGIMFDKPLYDINYMTNIEWCIRVFKSSIQYGHIDFSKLEE